MMEKVGCMDYSVTAWEPVRADVYQRQVHYRIDKKSSRHEGEVMSTQQRSPLPDKNGWLVEEVVTFEGIPVGECFNVSDNFLVLNYLVYHISKHSHIRLYISIIRATILLFFLESKQILGFYPR
jgi:hypothetical protein